jgi:uroporphyrinogen-III synthase
VDFVVSYQRARPRLDAAQLQLAREAAADGSVWLFSSSEALANLLANLPGQDWHAARAVATHHRIAAAAQQAGFGTVLESRPALADIRASMESMK